MFDDVKLPKMPEFFKIGHVLENSTGSYPPPVPPRLLRLAVDQINVSSS